MTDAHLTKNFAILGFGVTGQSILSFLIRTYSVQAQLNINIYDEKELSSTKIQNNIQTDLTGPAKIQIQAFNDLKQLSQATNYDLVVTSPGIKPSKISDADFDKKTKILSDLELFVTNDTVDTDKIFAITGTNGKSTACHLLAYLLEHNTDDVHSKVALGGNYGTPVLDFIDNHTNYSDYVLELSSYQLALTDKVQCLAATCLNISIDHLDWHGSYENYILDKLKIYNQSQFDIINLDQEGLLEHYFAVMRSLNKEPKIIAYTLSKEVSNNYLNQRNNVEPILWVGSLLENTSEIINGNQYIHLNNLSIIAVKNLPAVLQAKHNLSNFLAVLGLLLAKFYNNQDNDNYYQINDSLAVNYLQKFLVEIADYAGLPFRCELINEFNQVKIFNDSKSTNLDATIVALESVKQLVTGKIWLILGGIVKEDVDDLQSQEMFIKSLDDRLAGVIIFGKNQVDRTKLLNIINQANQAGAMKVLEIPKQEQDTHQIVLDKIVGHLFSSTIANDAILFSPACASFDMFNNYIHRGEMFNQRIDAFINNQST